jgi:hypothetical protein
MDANESIAVLAYSLVFIHILGFCRGQKLHANGGFVVDQIVERVSVWSASLMDRPGGLSNILKCLDEAGVDLDFIIARRAPEEPGRGIVFISPLRGDREVRAASTLGFAISGSIAAVRVEGENEPGAAARLTDLIADADINMRGFSGAVVGKKYIAYIGFDSPGDANRAAGIIQEAEAVLV